MSLYVRIVLETLYYNFFNNFQCHTHCDCDYFYTGEVSETFGWEVE